MKKTCIKSHTILLVWNCVVWCVRPKRTMIKWKLLQKRNSQSNVFSLWKPEMSIKHLYNRLVQWHLWKSITHQHNNCNNMCKSKKRTNGVLIIYSYILVYVHRIKENGRLFKGIHNILLASLYDINWTLSFWSILKRKHI